MKLKPLPPGTLYRTQDGAVLKPTGTVRPPDLVWMECVQRPNFYHAFTEGNVYLFEQSTGRHCPYSSGKISDPSPYSITGTCPDLEHPSSKDFIYRSQDGSWWSYDRHYNPPGRQADSYYFSCMFPAITGRTRLSSVRTGGQWMLPIYGFDRFGKDVGGYPGLPFPGFMPGRLVRGYDPALTSDILLKHKFATDSIRWDRDYLLRTQLLARWKELDMLYGKLDVDGGNGAGVAGFVLLYQQEKENIFRLLRTDADILVHADAFADHLERGARKDYPAVNFDRCPFSCIDWNGVAGRKDNGYAYASLFQHSGYYYRTPCKTLVGTLGTPVFHGMEETANDPE